jgi:UPF0755 protein
MLRLLGSALCLVFLASGVAAYWGSTQLAPVAEGDAEQVLFVVESGDALGMVSRRLESRGLIRNARALELVGRVTGRASQIRAGEYALSASLAPREILDRIVEGRIHTYSTSLPEGWTAAQIGARLAAEGFVEEADFRAAVADPALASELGVPADSLEGYLFPETYRMRKGLSAREVARVLVGQFMAAWKQVEAGAAERGFSMHEVVTLASVVEKETGAADERPLIASVFSNRMERGMRLESDPTVIYGIPNFDGNLRRRDLDDPSNLYNTYRHRGLPPGPIASPGLDAMLAVVSPADTEYLFFVSRNDGTHKFSETYKEHVNAVNRFQRRVSTR